MLKVRKTMISGVLAMGLVGIGGGVAMAASPAQQLACVIRVDQPNAAVDAAVGRQGCSNVLSGTGKVMKDVFGPDTQVGIISGGGWGVKTVNGVCSGNGNYYSQFNSSTGASAQSGRVNRC